MMRCDSRFVDRPTRAVFLLDRAGLDAVEQRHELGERVVAVAAAVVDQVERDLALAFVDAVERHDARRVHDRRVEAGFAALVQEHAVEHVAGRGLEPERHVRQAEDRRRARQLGLDAADRLDGLHGVAAEVVVAGREREGERVEDQVGGLEAVALDRDVVDALRDAQLPVGGAGLALFVDGEADDRRAVLAGQAEHAVHALALAVAFLEVGRVEDRLAAVVAQAGLHHRGLGRVEHERQRCLGREAPGDLVHVEGAVAADVVDTHVEHVRAFLHLLARHRDARVVVGFEHRVAELPGTVRVGAFADREVGELLMERNVRVDRRAAGLVLGRAHHRRAVVAEPRDDLLEVLGRGAATAADDVEPELVHEAFVRFRERVGREVVVRVAVDHRRQARVGQRREVRARVLREVAQVLGHLGRAGRAVHADHVGLHRFERGERGADLGADEHPAGGLHGHLHHQREQHARRFIAARAPLIAALAWSRS